MSGIDDLMAESNERRTVAMRRAEGVQDNGEAIKRYYTRYCPLGLHSPWLWGGNWSPDFSRILQTKDLTFWHLGFHSPHVLPWIGGLIYNAKKVVPAVQSGRIDVLLSLESDERKRIRRQITGKAPLDIEHLPVVRAAAVQLRKNVATQLLVQPMIPLIFIPQAVNFARRGDSRSGGS